MYWKPRHLSLIWSKRWHHIGTTVHKPRCVQLSHLMWLLRGHRSSPACRMSTEDKLSEDRAVATPIYLYMPSKSQLPPSFYWIGLGGVRGGREGPQGPPKPAPTAVTAPPPPGPSRGRWRRTRRDIGVELDPRDAAPYPELSCVRSAPPPRCLDAARSYSWLLRCWERRGESFIWAPRFPTTANAKRAQMTGAAVHGGVIT